MATWTDVKRIVASLPETAEGTSYGNVAWTVKGKGFAWNRPLRKSDVEALGSNAPKGEILAAYVESLLVKDLALSESTGYFFTTPHFEGYPAILVELAKIPTARLRDVLERAWLCRAPRKLADSFLSGADQSTESVRKSVGQLRRPAARKKSGRGLRVVRPGLPHASLDSSALEAG